MIIAVIPQTAVETLLNNLKEADWSLADVSVVMADQKLRDAIADDAGPLKGATPANLLSKLTRAGLSPHDAQGYVDSVAQGKTVVAMNAPKESEQAAVEMFKDYTPQYLKVTG